MNAQWLDKEEQDDDGARHTNDRTCTDIGIDNVSVIVRPCKTIDSPDSQSLNGTKHTLCWCQNAICHDHAHTKDCQYTQHSVGDLTLLQPSSYASI